jgi:hypothetical protein
MIHPQIANPQIFEVCHPQIANPQICNDPSENRKSANILDVPVRKSQIRKFERKKAVF